MQAQVKMQLNFQNVTNARVTCLRTHFIPPPHPKILYETLTMDRQGSKQVEITGSGDKRLTAVLWVTYWIFLSPQFIYKGKTDLCHPQMIELSHIQSNIEKQCYNT